MEFTLAFLPEPIFQDYLINDFSAGDASPSEEIIFSGIKFFKGHHAAALNAFHDNLHNPIRRF